MTNCGVILLAVLISCSIFNSNARGEGPSIKYQGNEIILTLPTEMEAAVERCNPQFKTWESGDYTATVRDTVRCAANPKQAPFVFQIVYLQRSDTKGGLLNDGGSISYYFDNGKFREGDFDPL